MPKDKDDDFSIDWNIDESLLKDWDNLPMVDSSTDELLKSWGANLEPWPDLSFSDEDLSKLTKELSLADSEFNFDWSEADLSAWTSDGDARVAESEPSAEPDPNLTAKDVAEWMLKEVETKGELFQKDAAWHIRRNVGKRFIYLNENHNPAISREVLKEFLLISMKTVVWNRRERYWRVRQPNDPPKCRVVDS
ncbi:hypothetical protein [Cyanobium sp. Copco_Reservoir_LC18]|uniref:DUF6953 family protein n=1 Tax=Cyanobium sp. Copco_Reservoir_LC18 TaxID=1328305 RepID=UPI0013572EE6|nr:hypothetical protein [Cyanobium sp. Copco_Reservoir_LC18]